MGISFAVGFVLAMAVLVGGAAGVAYLTYSVAWSSMWIAHAAAASSVLVWVYLFVSNYPSIRTLYV